MNEFQIAVRLEGGLGDCLAANRFIPAIYEKFPNINPCTTIHAFIDSEGNPLQARALRSFYPHFYQNITTIPSKKYKPFFIDSQFGTDENFGALENIPDEYNNRMEYKYDRFYDLHIDGMKWIKYDFDWLRYFKFFPKPIIQDFSGDFNFLPEKYVVLHLASNNLKSAHTNDVWYNQKLIKKISDKIPCVILCTKDTEPYLKECLEGIKESNYYLLSPTLEQTGFLISRAKTFLGMDSGLVYLAYGLGIATYLFSAHCTRPGEVLPSHHLRWLIYPEKCLPKNFDLNYVSSLIVRTVDNPAYNLVPFLNDFEGQAIVRKYSVNTEKSIRL